VFGPVTGRILNDARPTNGPRWSRALIITTIMIGDIISSDDNEIMAVDCRRLNMPTATRVVSAARGRDRETTRARADIP